MGANGIFFFFPSFFLSGIREWGGRRGGAGRQGVCGNGTIGAKFIFWGGKGNLFFYIFILLFAFSLSLSHSLPLFLFRLNPPCYYTTVYARGANITNRQSSFRGPRTPLVGEIIGNYGVGQTDRVIENLP